jgi:hypothetical protein
MALTSRRSFLVEKRSPAIPHTHSQLGMRCGRLHDHLVRDHGRTGRELDGLPLADLHRFEHVEQAMGMNSLSHQHPAVAGPHARVSAEPTMIPVKLS